MALRRALRRVAHGAEAVASLSRHYVASEVRRTYAGMMVALPPEVWAVFRGLEAGALAEALRALAGRVRPGDYRQATRGPKKPPAAKARSKSGGHVATQRLIDGRKKPVS